MTMWMLASILPFAAVGFVLLVQTSPLGRIPHKPFSCRVCLSGWGSIIASGLVLAAHGAFLLPDLAIWFALSVYGTGAARLILSAAEAFQAYADRAQEVSLPDDFPAPNATDGS